MKYIFLFFILLAFILASTSANALNKETRAKIRAAGVPEGSLERILNYVKVNLRQSLSQDVYACRDREISDVRICRDMQRKKVCRGVTIHPPRYVVSIDFGKPSTEERFYFIDLKTGKVEKFHTTHGRGSGRGKWAHKFSNIRDSEQTSLGLFRVGEIFKGGHGKMLRLYGLEPSNDQAYHRDIVMHAAAYATPEFIKRINPKTKAPFDRLGLSWGCPAISPKAFERLLPLLKDGSIIDFYHAEAMKFPLASHEVRLPEPVDREKNALTTSQD